MGLKRKDSLKKLSKKEDKVFQQISRSRMEPASKVARAKALLAVNERKSYRQQQKNPDVVPMMLCQAGVSRFNEEGLESLSRETRRRNSLVEGKQE